MALYANSGYSPLAYGVVEKENKDHWVYFFKALRLSLEGANFSKMTFILDIHSVCLHFSNQFFTVLCIHFIGI